jgi:hypothetical protein
VVLGVLKQNDVKMAIFAHFCHVVHLWHPFLALAKSHLLNKRRTFHTKLNTLFPFSCMPSKMIKTRHKWWKLCMDCYIRVRGDAVCTICLNVTFHKIYCITYVIQLQTWVVTFFFISSARPKNVTSILCPCVISQWNIIFCSFLVLLPWLCHSHIWLSMSPMNVWLYQHPWLCSLQCHHYHFLLILCCIYVVITFKFTLVTKDVISCIYVLKPPQQQHQEQDDTRITHFWKCIVPFFCDIPVFFGDLPL